MRSLLHSRPGFSNRCGLRPGSPLHSPAPRTCLLPWLPSIPSRTLRALAHGERHSLLACWPHLLPAFTAAMGQHCKCHLLPATNLASNTQALRQYDPAPRPKQDLKELVSAVQELPFLNSSSQVEQTSQLLWCFADWAKQPENRRARMTQAQCHAVLDLLQRMAGGAGGVKAGEPTHYTAKQLSLSAWSLSKLKPHLPAAAVTSACTALARHSATSEAMKRAGWRDWSNLLHGLATAGMQCSSSPDLTRLCDQAVQLLPKRVARGADSQSISMKLWAMAKSGYTGSAQLLLQSVTAAISQGEVMRDAKPQAWANLIWATSKLPGCREEARQLLSLFAIRAQAVVPGLEAQSISNILYAMSLVMWHHEEVCKQLTERAAQTQQAANGQDLANSLYALARLAYLDSSVRSLAAGVAKADLAAFTTQAIVNLLYARSMFHALSIHQAVSSGHSQLASEPHLNSMAAALWRECGRRGQGEGQWNDMTYTQLYKASQWLHACTGGQTTLATIPAVRELVAKAAAHQTSIMGALQAALQQSDNSRLFQALTAAGYNKVQQAALSQDGTGCTQLLVQGPGLTRGISVDQSPNFLPDGRVSGVVAHAKLQQLTQFDAGVLVNKAVFDQLGSDSERAAFMRDQVRASLPEAEAWRQLLLAEGGHAAQAKSAGKSVLPSQRAGQAPGLLPRPVRPRVDMCLPARGMPQPAIAGWLLGDWSIDWWDVCRCYISSWQPGSPCGQPAGLGAKAMSLVIGRGSSSNQGHGWYSQKLCLHDVMLA
ncbi:RAP domain-containing protein [Haematococcus lacustris]|uniref:RAP domain-containing protein n=1 Tax=Haematococcus lacustris TaxID=44745 RepID=A0A699Z0H5_HAELA|nr:RAP domain-containing protein [Haematococcus lacustris]